jgi:glycogen(starch) synthase
MMRLLYWTPRFWPDFGGIQTLSENALPELAKRGYEITVLTSHNDDRAPEVNDFKGIEVHRYAFWSALQNNNIFQVARINQSIHKKVIALEPDLIHYDFSGYTVLYLQSLLKRHPLPYLAAVHGDLPGDLCQPGSTIHKLFSQADWVTGISDAILTNVQSLIPAVQEKATTVHGFAHFVQPNSAPPPDGKPLILGIGRLEHEKGFDVLIQAASLLSDQGLDFDLKILGDGSLRQALQEQVLENGLSEQIQFMGKIPHQELSSWIAQANLAVIPTRGNEAFGMVAAEVGLMGQPVVASKLGGLPEVIKDNETGILVKEESPEELADAIQRIITHPKLAKEMGKAAQRRIQNQFTLSNYLDSYDHLYQKIVSAYAAN